MLRRVCSPRAMTRLPLQAAGLLGAALFLTSAGAARAGDVPFGGVAYVRPIDFSGSGTEYSTDFGSVKVGEWSAPRIFEIVHDGNTPYPVMLEYLDPNPSDEFEVKPVAYADVGHWFGPGTNWMFMRVQVRFHPKAAGTRSHVVRLSMIRYTTSGPNDTVRDVPHFNLVGIGTAEPPPPIVVDDSPDLRNGWYLNSSPQAIGTYYYSTYCTDGGAVSTATWEGPVQQAGNYKVEVFIPRQGFSVTPRTNNATYQIFHAGAGGQATAAISQNVTSSDWVSLGTFAFQGSYRIVLTDQTGEPTYSHWVIADAVRLTPAP